MKYLRDQVFLERLVYRKKMNLKFVYYKIDAVMTDVYILTLLDFLLARTRHYISLFFAGFPDYTDLFRQVDTLDTQLRICTTVLS